MATCVFWVFGEEDGVEHTIFYCTVSNEMWKGPSRHRNPHWTVAERVVKPIEKVEEL